MKDFLKYIATGCISFTFSCVFYLILRTLHIFPPIDEQLVITLLFISISIMLFIYLTHLLPVKQPLISRLLEVLVVLVVLLVASIFFNMVPLKFVDIFFVLAIGLLTYVIVIVILFIGDLANARQINTIIRTRKKEGEQ